ncbi:hypothetical protein niasHT_006652 [Heterodera trifolii]|uniref:Protein-tyrosine-phosphatase n=1 Tax=Heterodera trifolii TaxID=157864 RepID=A0ABD2M9W1_9BILA
MALLLLPLLAYVAAQDGIKKQQQNNGGQSFTGGLNNAEIRRAVNGTEFMLECPRAAYLVRTHMAPDFEHPQLVRRLDWLHDGALVASYQQELLSTDINQQWWVSGNRYTLRRPFFELRIAPLLAHDAGQWQCQLDTDPLFEAELPKLVAIELLVLVRPPVPPKPTVIRHTDRSATLQWDKYASSAAHQPIIRFSILVAKIEDSSLRVVSTPDNRTSIKIEGLWPNTRYAFSIRAENAIGESAFGPEVLFRTIGQPPRTATKITTLKNGTTPDCVELDWDYPELDKELTPIVGFRIMIHRVGTGAVREWYVKGNNARSQTLCTLEAYADYVLTMEADNGFGYSPGETMPFRTDESVPNDPPQLIQIRPVIRGEALYLTWREPSQPCGIITDYIIYFKDVPSKREMSRLSLSVAPNEPSKAFAYNLTKLLPNNRYKIQLAAATKKGEGIRSDALLADTDYSAPREAPTVTNLSYSCDSSQLAFHWSAIPSSIPAGATANFRVHLISSLGHSRIFNVTAASLDKKNTAHKLLIDKVQQNERISLTILASVQSRADPTVWLDGPISTPAHFVLLAAGWKCRFRSSACPPANWLSKTIICEHFATTNSAGTQQFAAGHPHQADQQRGDANGHFIFLIFGAAITFAISVLFTCILRRRCFLFKAFLRHNKKHHQKRGPSVSEKSHQRHRGAESTSLVQRGMKDAQLQGESVVLPPITLLPNGGTTADGIGTMPTSNGTNGLHLATTCACPTVDDQNEQNVHEAADDEAENVLPTVSVLHFDAYFEEMSANANTGFKRQFKELELDTVAMLEREQASSSDGEHSVGRASRCSATMAMSNNEGEKLKNRYVDVNALPRKSRIQLVDPRTGCLQHYINANYVDSCDEKRAYIATQAPLPHTFADFWAMVWQERSSVLVALTNIVESGLKKCDQYWPNCVGDFVQADDFRITLNGQRTNSVFTHRVLQLTKTSLTLSNGNGDDHGRTVHQLHFMAWPDHGVPDSPFPLLHFINYVAELHQCSTTAITTMPSSSSSSTAKNSATINGIGTIYSTAAGTASTGPCVVHCSAGVGRSGAFILIDSLRRHLLRCDRIDVVGQLRRMRRQRAQLVQTLDQFIFCHEVLRHLVANGITRQPRTHFANYVRFLLSQRTPAGQRRIRAQFTDLLRCPHQPQRCGPPSVPQCVPLPGYHRTDEFLLLLGFSCGSATAEDDAEQHTKQQMLWQKLWNSSCQAVVLLDSCPDGQTHLELPSQFEETDQNGLIRSIDLVRMDNTNVQLRRDDGKELFIALHRISSTALLHNPWLQIERLQCELQQQHRAQLAVLELGTTAPSAVPFLFCVFQSLACQLEQEGAIDVLLWLALYRHSVCGCWTEQSEVELVYRRVLELIELQKIIN